MRKYISISAIKIAANRQRRVFNEANLRELGESISNLGLFHPLVLRVEGEDYVLVSGERRLRAMTDLHALEVPFSYDSEPVPLNAVPYVSLSDVSELEAEEAEYDENMRRTDLSWQEKATAAARLQSLRSRQAIAAGLPAPTVATLSMEIRGSAEGVNHETTRREIILAQHLDNPLVAKAKTSEEAFKILRKEETATKHRELGATVGRTFTADIHTVLNEDSLSWMAQCPAESFDVILTDPPYGMGADEFGDSGGVAAGAHGYTDDYETFMRAATALAFEGYRIAKPQAHAYIFCDPDKFSQLKALMTEAGWTVFRTPLIWYKKSGMRAPWPELGPQRKYETILYAIKGKRPILKMAGDVLDFPPDANLGHAAQKPVALFQELLSRSALPGNTVLDPFCGSGPVFAAAHALKCRATGIEMDTASYGIAVQRIESLRAQQEPDLEMGL